MRTPEEILREIVLVVAAIAFIFVALVILKFFGPDDPVRHPNLLVVLPFIPALWLGYKSMRWMLDAARYITGKDIVILRWDIFVAYLIGLVAAIIVIPIGLLVLTLQYFRAKYYQSAR